MRKSAFQTVLLAGVFAAILLSSQTVFADPNPVGWWKFDEGSGSTAHDSAGSNDANVYGATWTNGRIDGALDFNGVSDYVETSDDTLIEFNRHDSFSISLWCMPSESGFLVAKTQAGGPPGNFTYRLSWSSINSRFRFFVDKYDVGSISVNTYNDSAPAGYWYHVVAVYDNKDMTIYLNGEPHENGTFTYNTGNTYPEENLLIGAQYLDGYFGGSIDDVRIYDIALSAEEIEQLYQEVLGKASIPNPFNGVTGVDLNAILSWQPGNYAASHDVYLGTDYNDVNEAGTGSPEYMGNFDVNSYDPCGLDSMTTYYWRIDEVNEPNIWKGDVWSFETVGPIIGLSATQFEFAAIEGGSNPDDQILGIYSVAGTLNWEISDDSNWLSAEPNSGSSTGEVDDVNLSVDISGLAVGIYDCNLTVSDPNASNNPQTVGLTLYVSDADGTLYVPSEYSTIQAAMDIALDGDVVIVAPGTYTGAGNYNLDFLGKAITVRSSDPNDPCVIAATVIDCEYANGHQGFYFHSGEDANSVVSGLTITRGWMTGDDAKGAGIYCHGSSPRIKNCIIANNRTSGYSYGLPGDTTYGAGIYCESMSNPVIVHCIISGNHSTGGTGFDGWPGGNSYGGGIYLTSDSNPMIKNCIIYGNMTTGGTGGQGLDDEEFGFDAGDGGDGFGAGIYCESGSAATIENCTISNNTTVGGTGGSCGSFFCEGADGTSYGGGFCGDTVISNCILWGNTAENSPQIYGSPTASYSDVEGGYSGQGNIDADPCFVDATGGDYHLSPGSGCINAGDPCYIQEPNETDIDGEPRVMDGRVDMGADEFLEEAAFIELTPAAFEFIADEGGANPETQILSIRNSGGGTLNWEVSEDCNWLTAEPNIGSSTGEVDDVNVSIDISGLVLGLYNCELTITANGALNSPQTVEVTLFIGTVGELHVPEHYETIQAAIDAADSCNMIIVADSTYTGVGNYNIDFKGKEITLQSENGPENCIIDCQNAYPDRRAFYFHSSEGPNSIVSGFTIKRGRVSVDNSKGGGIYCTESSPTIEDCNIISNKAVGVIDSYEAYGGGVYCTSNSNPTFINCVIKNNFAHGGYGESGLGGGYAYGGGLYCTSNSSLTIIDCTIIDNSAKGGHGADEEGIPPNPAAPGGKAYGGGIYGSNLTIKDCIIANNTAEGGGGGIGWYMGEEGGYAYGGGLYCGGSTITNCTISNNKADGGEGGEPGGFPGAACCGGAYVNNTTIKNCIINGNQVWASDAEPGPIGIGGGLYCTGSSSVVNCSIINNREQEDIPEPIGIGIYCTGSQAITNCILWDNEGQDVSGGLVTYSCIEQVVSGTGNIYSDPCFVTGPLGDYYLSQIAAGQAVDSPCVDAGSDTAENLGMDLFTTRTDSLPDTGLADMGYHYYSTNPADIDGDGDADFVDYAILARAWLSDPMDANWDGRCDIAEPPDEVIDILDLEIFIQNWLEGD